MARRNKRGWLQAYLKYTEGQESPSVFHLWVGMSVIAATLERNVYLDRSYYKLYPNLYTILVAGSALCRKSAAVKIGQRVMEATLDTPNVLSQKLTPEAMIQAMSQNATADPKTGKVKKISGATIIADELSVFLGRTAYESGLLALLTTFYDCPGHWSYETKTHGKQELDNVCVNIIAASTPEWLRTSIPNDAIGGGFMSRTILVYSERPKPPIPFPEKSKEVLEIERKLIDDLNEIRKLEGAFNITAEARHWYIDWYEKEISHLLTDSMGEFMVRRPDTLLKLAMIMSVSEGDTLIIERQHLESARHALDTVRDTMHRAVETLVTTTASDPIAKVLSVIRRHRAISHRDLVQRTWRYCNSEMLASVIDTLSQGGYIRVEMQTNGNRMYYIERQNTDVDEFIENLKEG